MAVGGRLGLERSCHKYLRRRCGQKIVSAHDLRYAHEKIVHHSRKRIPGTPFIARKRKIAKRGRNILRIMPCENIVELNSRPLLHAKAPARKPRRTRRLCGLGP